MVALLLKHLLHYCPFTQKGCVKGATLFLLFFVVPFFVLGGGTLFECPLPLLVVRIESPNHRFRFQRGIKRQASTSSQTFIVHPQRPMKNPDPSPNFKKQWRFSSFRDTNIRSRLVHWISPGWGVLAPTLTPKKQAKSLLVNGRRVRSQQRRAFNGVRSFQQAATDVILQP